MKRGTQRAIYTAAWLGVLGYGAYFVNKNFGGRIFGSLDRLFGPQTSNAATNIVTGNTVTAPTGDPESDDLLLRMFRDLKDYKTGMFSYMTYLQGEYGQPGASSGAATYTAGPARFT